MERDLKVDGGSLSDTAASLRTLRSEFDALDRRGDQDRQTWGSADVARAMERAASDWDDNRRRIAQSMASVGAMAEACVREFDGVESTLSAAFDR